MSTAAGLALVNGEANNGGPCSNKGICTSLFSGFSHVQSDLNIYTKQMLDKSFDFLLLSSVFDVYTLDRPGFEKLYRKVSDKAWEDTIDLIKYQSRRGGYVQLSEKDSTSEHTVTKLLQSNETSSLELALEYEKLLATEAHRMHKTISHTNINTNHYDPDVAHYLDEKLIKYQSGQIRKLSGYITNLRDIVNEPNTKELGILQFDDYLNKVE